jgi:tetratricopeptide (TPR) repeat protein
MVIVPSFELQILDRWLDATAVPADMQIATQTQVEALFQAACAVHRQSKLGEARGLYQQALQLQPMHHLAWHQLGLVALQMGEPETALKYLGAALAIAPQIAAFHVSYGNALSSLARYQAAADSYDKAIELRPLYADACCNRGLALASLGRIEAAIESYDRAISIRGEFAEALCNRGNALKILRRLDEALASYDRAIAIKPGLVAAHSNRCLVLRNLGRLDAALISGDRAIAIDPGNAEAHANRGLVLQDLHEWDAARESYDRAIAIKTDYSAAHYNRGNLLYELNQPVAAVASFDRALAADADCVPAYFNRSLALLLAGDFARGWAEYECRWKQGHCPVSKERRGFSEPLWLGSESIAGKTILLHGEQGLGDIIQFVRYAPLVESLGARVILEVPRPLLSLFESLEVAAQRVACGDPLPRFDYYCPLLSLPLAFKTTLADIPAQVPYLRADEQRLRYWSAKFRERRRPRVGLVWSGGFRPDQPELWAVNDRRNIPLGKFSVLRHLDIEFYSLQIGQPAQSELADLIERHWDGPPICDFTADIVDFADTAALIEQLDLVISVDTSTAHLAGALGKPVWIMNRFDTCWRWLLGRTDSPWYPTVRLYRQERWGDWDGVLQRVAVDLEAPSSSWQ